VSRAAGVSVAALALLALLPVPGDAGAAPFGKSGIADWTVPPVPGPEPSFAPPAARRLRLRNGAALVVLENHTLPIAAIDVVVLGAGTAADPKRKRGLAAFTADMLDEGAGGMSALAISDEEARLGAEIELRADDDAARISVSALSRTLEPTLDLLAKIMTQPAFDAAELDRVKGDRMTSLAQRRDRPREVVALVLDAALFGPESAYGHPGPGVQGDVKGITPADVQGFYRAHWSPAATTFVVAGDVDAAAIAARLDAALGGWRAPGAKPPAVPAATAARLAHRLLLVDRPGAAQSDVRIGRIDPDRHDPRYFAFEVLRTILGDGFISRLNQRLREQLGITYGAAAGVAWLKTCGRLAISTAIVSDKTATGLAETFKILDDLASHEVDPAELDRARQKLVRALPRRFETNAGAAAAFAELVLGGLPDDWYGRIAGGVAKVTAADVAAAAKALMSSGSMAIAVVGDVAKIRGELDKLGLGSPAMYDLDAAPLPAK
jgi:zinc protease